MSATAFQRRRRQIAKKQADEQKPLLAELTVTELKAMAKSMGLSGYSKLKEAELIELIEKAQVESE
jgi:large subunit ribosomal protein L21